MTEAKHGKIITFYSYKGGTGRSMALANIAWILASNSKRVLVVDWDLEAPGLQRYFRPFLVDRELTSSPGVVDLITDFILEAITPLEKGEELAPDWFLPQTDIDPYVISLNWKFPTGGQLDFIPAGRQGPDYGQRFAAINWQKFYDVLGGGAFIEQLKINMRSQYDYILVDSRTGVSDTSGICTIQLPDTLVVCFTFNNQSIEGAASVTQGVFEQRTVQDSHLTLSGSDTKEASPAPAPDRFYQSPYRFKVFPVPMRVDQGEKDKLAVRQAYSRRKFDPFLDRMTVVDRKAFWGAVAVPYVAYFSYEEILAPFKDDPADPATCLAAFIRISREITELDVTGFVPLISPEERDRVLQEFASVPIPESVRSTAAADNGKVVAPKGGLIVGAVTVAGTASVETAESQLESSLRRAEATFRSLDDQEREQARLLWMRLVRIPRPGENIENTKVRVPLKEIGGESTPVIQRFATADVVTVSRDYVTGEPTVEVKDEELLRSWPTLDSWIKNDRDLMLWRQDLRSSMAQWEERGRKWDDLLVGRRLWQARLWYKTHRRYLNYNEVAYIEASLRWFSWITVSGVAAVVVLLVGIYLQQTFSDTTKMAESIATDAESQIVSATRIQPLEADQFQLGLLLAIEAQQLAPTAKAEALLKTNLARLPQRLGSFDSRRNVLDFALSPSGLQVLSVTGTARATGQSEDWAAQINNVSKGETLLRVPFKQGSRRFVLSPDARYLAVVSTQGKPYPVDIVEADTGETIFSIEHEDQVSDMAFSPDGNYFATASRDRRARVLNLKRRGLSPFELRYNGAVNGVRFSGDSQHLAVASDDLMVHVLRNLPSATQFSDSRHIKVGSMEIGQFALSYDGRYLVTATFEETSVDLWDVETEKMTRSYSSAGAFLYSSWFTPDSKFLLAAEVSVVHVWGVLAGDTDNRIRYAPNNPIIFSDDGKYFAAFEDNVARIWEYNGSSFNETASILLKSNLLSLRFGNPNFVVTAGADNLITVWKLGEPVSNNLRYEACSRLSRNLTLDEWNAHVASYLGAYRRTCSEIP